MNPITAKTGLNWISSGFRLFRKRPFFFTNLFFAYFIGVIFLGQIPVIGQILPILLAPAFSLLFMQVSLEVDQDRQFSFTGLFSVFTKRIFIKLIMLGCLYLLIALLISLLTVLVDGGVLLGTYVQGQGISHEISASQRINMFLALILMIVVYIPFTMAFWFATPLIGWKNMSLGKAIFYSFFVVIHSLKAFIVYVFGWIVLVFILPSVIGVLLTLIVGQPIATYILMAISVILTVWMYCSFYPTYKTIFGLPDSNIPIP